MLDARKDIIDFFEKEIFPYKGNVFKTTQEESEEESEEEKNLSNILKINQRA